MPRCPIPRYLRPSLPFTGRVLLIHRFLLLHAPPPPRYLRCRIHRLLRYLERLPIPHLYPAVPSTPFVIPFVVVTFELLMRSFIVTFVGCTFVTRCCDVVVHLFPLLRLPVLDLRCYTRITPFLLITATALVVTCYLPFADCLFCYTSTACWIDLCGCSVHLRCLANLFTRFLYVTCGSRFQCAFPIHAIYSRTTLLLLPCPDVTLHRYAPRGALHPRCPVVRYLPVLLMPLTGTLWWCSACVATRCDYVVT